MASLKQYLPFTIPDKTVNKFDIYAHHQSLNRAQFHGWCMKLNAIIFFVEYIHNKTGI